MMRIKVLLPHLYIGLMENLIYMQEVNTLNLAPVTLEAIQSEQQKLHF